MADSGNVIVFQTDPARLVLRLVPNLSAPGSLDPETPHPALADTRVRQAIRHAIDVGRLSAEVFNGQAIPADTELSQLDCNILPYDYNPGLAAALLDQAGWVFVEPDDVFRRCQGCGTAEDGTPLSLNSYTYVEFGDRLAAAHQMIGGMLAEVGIDLQRQAVDGSILWDTWAKDGLEIHGNFDLDLWDDGYYGVDPTIYLTDYFDPRSIPSRDNPNAGLNISRYRNPDLVKLFDALHTPLPDNRRRALLCELGIVLHQDLPQIPLLALPDWYAIHPAVARRGAPHLRHRYLERRRLALDAAELSRRGCIRPRKSDSLPLAGGRLGRGLQLGVQTQF